MSEKKKYENQRKNKIGKFRKEGFNRNKIKNVNDAQGVPKSKKHKAKLKKHLKKFMFKKVRCLGIRT